RRSLRMPGSGAAARGSWTYGLQLPASATASWSLRRMQISPSSRRFRFSGFSAKLLRGGLMNTDQSPPRLPPGQIPTDIKALNEKLIKEFRANRGQLRGQMAGRTLMLLTTTGAKSKRERTAVLGFGKDGDRYVVIASGN